MRTRLLATVALGSMLAACTTTEGGGPRLDVATASPAIPEGTGYFAQEAFGLSTQDAQRFGVTPVLALFHIGLALLPLVKSRQYEVKAG